MYFLIIKIETSTKMYTPFLIGLNLRYGPYVCYVMFVKLLTDVNGLYILWVSAEMAYNFYNISAGCPMQIDFNLKHWKQCIFRSTI